jgi:hypothetical protein
MNNPRSNRSELSKDAYHALNLAECQREVLEVLQEYGPLTANGIAAHLPHNLLRNVRSRLNELEEKGVVEGIEKVRDPLSKRRVIRWAAGESDGTSHSITSTTKRSKTQAKLASLANANLELGFQVTELKDALHLNRERLRVFFNEHPSMLKHWHDVVVSARRDGREKLNALEDEFPPPR